MITSILHCIILKMTSACGLPISPRVKKETLLSNELPSLQSSHVGDAQDVYLYHDID